jgi:hypothetical protein
MGVGLANQQEAILLNLHARIALRSSHQGDDRVAFGDEATALFNWLTHRAHIECLGRLKNLQPLVSMRRYEFNQEGDIIHVDIEECLSLHALAAGLPVHGSDAKAHKALETPDQRQG